MVEMKPTIVLENAKKTRECYMRDVSGNTAIGDFLYNLDLATSSLIGSQSRHQYRWHIKSTSGIAGHSRQGNFR